MNTIDPKFKVFTLNEINVRDSARRGIIVNNCKLSLGLLVLLVLVVKTPDMAGSCAFQRSVYQPEWCMTLCGTDWVYVYECVSSPFAERCISGSWVYDWCGRMTQPYDCWEEVYFQ